MNTMGIASPKGLSSSETLGSSILSLRSVRPSTQASFRSILHDTKTYKDPLLYNPDRFMKNGKIDPTVWDPMVATFGYGRRICPGRFFSENFLFILICHLLTVYDIRPGLGDDGEELEIKPEMMDGLVS